jgi:hypothetical protein
LICQECCSGNPQNCKGRKHPTYCDNQHNLPTGVIPAKIDLGPILDLAPGLIETEQPRRVVAVSALFDPSAPWKELS